MDENAGPARWDQIGARSVVRRSALLLLVWFAGNVVVATLAWFLVVNLQAPLSRGRPFLTY
jgi:hypothetical protein